MPHTHHTLLRWLQQGFFNVIEIFFPRYCHGCGTLLSLNEKHICPTCYFQITLFQHYDWKDNKFFWQWFDIRSLQRVGNFTFYAPNDIVANIVKDFKYNHHPELGTWMGEIAATQLLSSEFFEGVDILIPIPTTRRHIRQRGYSPPELIAKGISNITKIPLQTNILHRKNSATSQTHFIKEEREKRIQLLMNEFFLDKHALSQCEGKHVMIVDDVITTGTTMTAALHTMLQIPNIKISVFVWAEAR